MDICKVGARITCTSCSHFFSTRDGPYGRAARRPLLLTCGHTWCESCVQSALSGGKDSVKCHICSTTCPRDLKNAKIYADFPVNMFVLGAVAAHQWIQRTGDAQVTFAPPGASVRRLTMGRVVEAPTPQQTTPEVCEECVSRPCDYFCQQCELKYCNACFSKVHKAKALMKHVKVPPPVGKVKLMETQLCQKHKAKPLEFYCKQCDSNICAHCFVDTHRPHEVISLLEKNQDLLESMETVYEKGTKILKHLLHTQKKVERLRRTSSKQQAANTAPYSRVEQEIVQHFSLLHGLLQHVEQRLLSELAEVRAQQVDGLRAISQELSAHLTEVQVALESARVAMLPANLGLADIATVQEKLQAILDLPCHLVTTVVEDSTNTVEFTADNSLVENLASHCHLQVQSNANYSLVKFDDLPPDYVVDPVDDEPLQDDICPPLTSSSRTSSVSALSEEMSVVSVEQNQQPQQNNQQPQQNNQQPQQKNQQQPQQSKKRKSSESSSTSGRVMPFAYHERPDNIGANNTHPVVNIALDPANKEKAKNILIGTSEAVVVTHIKDPGDFYVQMQSDKFEVKSAEAVYKKLASSSTIPTEVKLNEIYLVCYKADSNWYRGRVISLTPKASEQSEQQVLVQYVDYGNSEVIAMSSLRVAPKSVLQSPFKAIHCGLHGIHPTGGKWSPESVKMFAHMIDNSVVLMIVLKYTADKYEVDLCRMPGGGEDVPSSVQDAMVFLGLAHYFQNVKRQGKQIIPKLPAFYNKSGLRHGDILDVAISHVENPSSFYIQKVDQSYLFMNEMMDKLGAECEAIGNKRLVYSPYLEMPCAAVFSADNRWYRARVVGLPGNRLVQVEYVDFGNKELVLWSKIRKLSEEYMQLPALAIHCSLNDVAPPDDTANKWAVKAGLFLQKHTANKIIRMFVDAAMAEVLKVTLYEVKPNVDICINALMVREGYAKSTGVSSSLVEFHKSVDDVQNVKLKIPSTKVKVGKSNTSGKKHRSKPPPVLKPQVDDVTDNEEEEEDVEDTVEEKEGPLKVEVKVLSVVNPSQLYVSIVSQQKVIASMMEEMQEFYHQCPKSDKDWDVGDPCAAYLTDKSLWFRAKIVELPNPHSAKVFLKDIGEVVLVEVVHLRELSNLFTQLHDGAVRCHLAGIKPAGSSSNWSILATEFLTTLVSQDCLFAITKKGEVENDSLPVELLVKEIIEEGPLIPTVEEWRAISNKLVDQGLAFTIRDETISSTNAGHKLLKALDKNSKQEDTAVSQWLSTQKSARSAGPRKSPKKLQTSTSVSDRSSTKTGKTVKPALQDLTSGIKQLAFSSEQPCPRKTPDLSESMVAHASEGESDDASDTQEQDSMPPLFDSWLPATPLSSYELWIVPSYVDMKCCIYFHDHQLEETLTVIGNGLNSRFSDSKPKPYDSYWSPGQACVAQYHSDKKWYRGQVISVKEDMSLEVLFVDYGNVETCKASELRKDVCMTHLPVQCHKARLHGLEPVSEDGSWPVRTLDFIHMTVVEKLYLAKLRMSTSGELLVTSLVGPGNLDLYQVLVNMHYCVLTYATGDADSDGSDVVYVEANDSAGEDVVIEDEQETAVCVAVKVEKSEIVDGGLGDTVASADSESCVPESAAECTVQDTAPVDTVPVNDEEQPKVDTLMEVEVVVADASINEGIKYKCSIVETLQQSELGDSGVGHGDSEKIVVSEESVVDKCSSSDSSDECEPLPRKPQSLMDWYDIITDEENKMNQQEKDCGDEDEDLAYHAMELPELEKFMVEVTAMLSINEVVLHLIKTETAKLKIMKAEFEELSRIMQIEGPAQEVLSSPSIGQPCCACYSEDGQWYRAMVVDFLDNMQIKIVYVDYGNTEILSAEGLHRVKPDWLQLPVQGVQARLFGVKEAPKQDHKEVVRRLAGCLFNPPVIAAVKSTAPLTVQILNCETLEPVYNSLFEDGLLMPTHT